MIDISGFGLGIRILALQSFPVGFNVTQYADDVNPLDVDEIEPVGYEMLYDGSLFAFNKAAAIRLSIGVIAGSDDDINMKVLLQSSKAASTLIPLPDVTSAVITYGNGGRILLSNGTILKGPLADSVQSAGRLKGNVYSFVFGSFAGAQSTTEVVSTIAQAAVGLFSV